jgi:hypothetical protein
MSVSPGSWFNVQFYRFVTGSYSSSHSSWDCSSPDWREHWVSRNELYCYDDFLRVMDAAQAAVASGVVLADPHSVAVAWGRAQGSPSPSAPPSYRPDGSLTQGSVAFVGDNVYNSTGAGQSIAGVPVRPGSSASFSWQVQNDGTLPDQIALSGQGRSTGFTIDFKNGSTDITGAVAAGTYTTSISPGASVTITLKITAASTAAIGVVKQELLTATSQDHVATDTVLASVTVVNPSPPFRPDGLLSLGGGSFVGDGVYGATGAGQTIDQVMVPRGGSATFSWQIQNDGVLTDLITLNGPGRSSGFVVDFKSGTTDITGNVVAGTFSRSLAPGASVMLTVKITALATAQSGATKPELMTAISQDNAALDAVLASITVT